jgi:excisionase family DNA binding protein
MSATIYECLITGEELSRRLNVSLATVERWVSQRFIPSYAFGKRCVRFDASEVRTALRKFERPALRRLPRGNYRAKARPPITRHEAEQLEFKFVPEDPAQLVMDLATAPAAKPASVPFGQNEIC